MKDRVLRGAIHAREHGCCFYCLRRIEPRQRCLDHVVPRANLGRNTHRNLVSSCYDRNKKKDRPAEEFLRWLFRERRLDNTELHMRCPIGLLVTPDVIEVFRDTYTAHSEKSIEQVASFASPKVWHIFKVPHHGSREPRLGPTAWDKDSRAKGALTELYDRARIWVHGDFLLQAPEKPEGWPNN